MKHIYELESKNGKLTSGIPSLSMSFVMFMFNNFHNI